MGVTETVTRKVKIIVKCVTDPSVTDFTEITQLRPAPAGPEIYISPESHTFPAAGVVDFEYEVTVINADDWTWASGSEESSWPSWMHLVSGSKSKTGFKLKIDETSTTSARSFTLKLTTVGGAGGTEATCQTELKQVGAAELYLTVTPKTWTSPAAGDSKEYTVDTNAPDWEFANSLPDWMEKSVNGNKFTITTKENVDPSTRDFTITVKTKGGVGSAEDSTYIKQEAEEIPEPEITVNPTEYSVVSAGGSKEFTVTVKNATGWVFAESMPDWLSVEEKKSGYFDLRIDTNTGSYRTFTIKLKTTGGAGGKEATCETVIKQAQAAEDKYDIRIAGEELGKFDEYFSMKPDYTWTGYYTKSNGQDTYVGPAETLVCKDARVANMVTLYCYLNTNLGALKSVYGEARVEIVCGSVSETYTSFSIHFGAGETVSSSIDLFSAFKNFISKHPVSLLTSNVISVTIIIQSVRED